jgi:hypothetical protein
LKEKIIEQGCLQFGEALQTLKFGVVEEFMIKVHMIDKIDKKVAILLKIIDFQVAVEDAIHVRILS